MTLRALVSGLALLVVASVGLAGGLEEARQFGQELSTELQLTEIAAILETPDDWVGKKVRIAGEVTGVCTKQGCWMDLTAPDDVTLRVKVDDGVIVFPREALGHTAVAEGKVEVLEMERDKYESYLRHLAEEEGREFDPAEVGDAPYRIVRLRGLGARISSL